MKYFIISLLILKTLLLSGCNETNTADTLHFATSAQYPPFEYMEQERLKGFDIDLATLVAKELGKKAVFNNMQFSSILPAVSSGQVDIAISTITITEARKINLDFSMPYYFESMAAVFKQNNPINTPAQLIDKKLACQLGTTMEIWVKKNAPTADLVVMDNNNQAIEALKAGHVEVVIMDAAQGAIFSQKNPGLSYALIAQSEDGYGLVLQKNSPLTAQVNQALRALKAKGAIKKLHQKWLENAKWKH